MKISKADLGAINQGLDEIEQATQGMFGLRGATLNLWTDGYDITAEYSGTSWDVDITEASPDTEQVSPA